MALKLNLGCGNDIREGWENIDRVTLGDSRIKAIDLEEAQLPYGDDSVDIIVAHHVLEHIFNLIPLMNECHRVLREDGFMEIAVPHFPHPDSVKDPDHKRFFVPETFRGYFCDYAAAGLFPFYQIKPWRMRHLDVTEAEIKVVMAPLKRR